MICVILTNLVREKRKEGAGINNVGSSISFLGLSYPSNQKNLKDTKIVFLNNQNVHLATVLDLVAFKSEYKIISSHQLQRR